MPSTKSKTKPAPSPNPQQSKYQAFTTETVRRVDLVGAPYNPRVLTEDAKRRLKASLQKVGLVQPIVWNKKTGNVVGGHQRLKQLDALEGSSDYTLTVAVLDVDEVREKEINVLLNNTLVSGDWDYDALKSVLNSEGMDIEATGFDLAEAMKLFGDDKHARNEIINSISDQLNSVKEAYEQMQADSADKDDTDFYNVVVFKSVDQRFEFLEALGLEDNRYVNGATLLKIVQDLKNAATNSPVNENEASVPTAGDGSVKPDRVS
jgi:hypothetical protein